ncbi:RNA exonuclease 4 isoform X3 [Macadamia integrifolia]|uniref:RNA exonuclease 4 isoform X3 n=1 Tax=Macadamia integrifolia TaxID=60698 RepID=UPI001C4EA0B7|nr:RNA exonuclease 4 isoform X3 [Macadamia integrifolia]
MGSDSTNPKRLPLNPNWAQLQQKLKSDAPKPFKPSVDSDRKTQESVLGKRKERGDAEPTSQKSILTPVTNDCSLTDALAMDCEMVGVSSEGNKSALGRVTLVNTWGNIVYDEYVRPVERVVDFRTQISGIRPCDLRKAKDFQSVQNKVAELINGRILVGHALRNDLKALLLSHRKKDIRDTSEYRPFLNREEGRKRSLRDLASELLGIKIQNGEHCSIEDARAAMLIYQKNKKEWEKSIKEHLSFKKKMLKRKHKKKPKTNLNQSVVTL